MGERKSKDGTQKGKRLPLCLEEQSRLTVADWNVIDTFIELLEHFENTILITPPCLRTQLQVELYDFPDTLPKLRLTTSKAPIFHKLGSRN